MNLDSTQQALRMEINGRVFYASERKGLLPIMFGIMGHGESLKKANVYCKDIDIAEAKILSHARPIFVSANNISRGALEVLLNCGVKVKYDNLLDEDADTSLSNAKLNTLSLEYTSSDDFYEELQKRITCRAGMPIQLSEEALLLPLHATDSGSGGGGT